MQILRVLSSMKKILHSIEDKNKVEKKKIKNSMLLCIMYIKPLCAGSDDILEGCVMC